MRGARGCLGHADGCQASTPAKARHCCRRASQAFSRSRKRKKGERLEGKEEGRQGGREREREGMIDDRDEAFPALFR